MSHLLTCSKTFLQSARDNLARVDDDYCAVDMACECVAMSARQAVICYCNLCNIEVWENASMPALLYYLDKRGFITPELHSIEKEAAKYEYWKTGMMQTHALNVPVSEVERAIANVSALQESIENAESNVLRINEEVYNWCVENAPEKIKCLKVGQLLEIMLPVYNACHK